MEISAIHTLGSVSPNHGGPSVSVPILCRNLVTLGCHVSLCTIGTIDNSSPLDDSLKIIGVKRSFKFSRYEYAIGLRRALSKMAADVDIIHSHGLWTQINRESALIASRYKKIHILSPRGMLEPWALNHHKWKKTIARWVFQDRALRQSSCLHATADQEYQSIRSLGMRNPVSIIPNGVDVDAFSSDGDREYIDNRWPELKNKRLILFLSRIHIVKGLMNLVHAWSNICSKYRDWHVAIAGPDEDGFEAHVRQAVADSSASQHTTFLGPVFGAAKKQLLSTCSIFVLPTFSENFGVAIAEALASGKPVITTKAAPWKVLVTHRCGWWIDIGVDPLSDTLKEAMELSDNERTEMGFRGRQLIETNYSLAVIANQMIEVYRWCLGQAAKPDCLRLD